ncbi:MAG TPA: hypothetical protein VMC09_14570 [Anaerolineales bacterium]|nr:hypothetical protein [Anaerolineales bacterium]
MAEKTQMKNSLTAVDQLREEFERQSALFDAQPAIVQRFLEAQASQIAEAFVEREHSIRFTLPDRVLLSANGEPLSVPQAFREQRVGKIGDLISRRDVHETLRQRLTELDQSSEKAVAVSAELIRYAAANHMVRNMLPSGRTVKYVAPDDDDIPSIPVSDEIEPESAITATTDAIAEESSTDDGRGNLQVPYVPAARRFYLPQWVAYDGSDKLIVNSVGEAEAHVASMQRFLTILFAARSLAPYMVADEEFEKKRYGMLGQLVNQGRALARYQTREIIRAIQERARAQSLNRGLSLSLPYFDDQDLRIEAHNFVIIPAGRIMFVPAFVVRAALEEQAKVAQDTRFSHSTRTHLMAELQLLGEAFESVGE